MEHGAHRELKVLEAIEANGQTTQRGLASQLGIALGLANLYLRRLIRKGYIKCVNVQSNRVLYLITPKGIAEKTRLTYEFMEYSLHIYKAGRRHLKAVLEPYAAVPSARIAIFGTGEAAELSYMCLKELGIEPVAVFGRNGETALFGHGVTSIANHAAVKFDLIIVATLDDPTAEVDTLAQLGIDRHRLVLLRPPQ